MTRVLYDQLENAGFLRGTEAVAAAVGRASVKELLDFANEAAEITSIVGLPRESSIFAVSASKALGAGRRPCASSICRSRRADELGRFAALYADRVYIHNFLTDPLAAQKHGAEIQEDILKESFFDDLTVLAHLRPIIEAGKVVVVTPGGVSCAQCLAEKAWGPDASKKLGHEFDRLEEELLCETQIEVSYKAGWFRVGISGPDRLIEHSRSFRFQGTPDALIKRPRILKQILAGKKLVLSRSASRELGAHSRLTSEVVGDLGFELAVTQALNTTFLVDRELYVDILASISAGSDLVKRNQIIAAHLTSLVPFAEDIDLVAMLQLREGEGDAFEQFRAALNAAVAEVQGRKGALTEADARQVYADTIAPKLANLDKKVSVARDTLRRGAVRKGAAWLGVISFGIYTGFLPAELVAAAKTLGLAKVLADFSEILFAQGDGERAIREEQLYFLWKVRQKSQNMKGTAF